MRAAGGPGLQARARKAVDLGFQARSDVELRPAEYIGEVTEAGALPGEQSRRERNRRQAWRGDNHGCGRKASEIWTDGDKSSPGLTHLQA